MTTFTVGELATFVNGEVRGDVATLISDGESLDKAGPEHIAFVDGEQNLRKLADCRAGCVVLRRSAAPSRDDGTRPATLLLVDDPLPAFLSILKRLRPPHPRDDIGISEQADISASATIGRHTNIHPHAVIGDDVVIGEQCDMHPGVVIGAGCRIGNNVVLHPNVVLYPGVEIGNDVTVHASAVIGADGFGYRLSEDRREKIPHYGTVRIDDHVEIGACTTIDRAMIGTTVIGEGTKIDNLVMIAHNCEVGRHNAIVGQVGFAGSVTTGDYVVVAGHVGVADHVHLAERCVIGSKAGVHKDVPEGETYIGLPAVPAAEAMRVAMAQKKLPEALKTVRALEHRVQELTAQLEALSPPSADGSAASSASAA